MEVRERPIDRAVAESIVVLEGGGALVDYVLSCGANGGCRRWSRYKMNDKACEIIERELEVVVWDLFEVEPDRRAFAFSIEGHDIDVNKRVTFRVRVDVDTLLKKDEFDVVQVVDSESVKYTRKVNP